MNVMPHTAMLVISVEKLLVTAQSDKGDPIDLVSDIRFTVQKGEVLALIGDPDVVILNEPTTALDVTT